MQKVYAKIKKDNSFSFEIRLTFLAGCPYTCLNLLDLIPRKFILAAGFWHMLVSNIATSLYCLTIP